MEEEFWRLLDSCGDVAVDRRDVDDGDKEQGIRVMG